MRSFDSAALLARLPPVRGRLQPMAPLAPYTWFRVGGPAEALFSPADPEDLAAFLAGTPADVPVKVIGVGSNLLVRDGGVRGVVIRLAGKSFGAAEPLESARLRAGAAALGSRAAEIAAEAGIGGLEFLRTIPGSIGGMLRMNAGCYGTEVKDRLVSVELVTRAGGRAIVKAENLGFVYRDSEGWPQGGVAVGALFQGRPEEPAAIRARMDDYLARREASQPTRARTGGSTFRNPSGFSTVNGESVPLAAWRLIDSVGGRGLRVGGAQVSEKHCNFLIAHEGATAADVEALGEELRRRVREAHGLDLHWEIRRIGEPLAPS